MSTNTRTAARNLAAMHMGLTGDDRVTSVWVKADPTVNDHQEVTDAVVLYANTAVGIEQQLQGNRQRGTYLTPFAVGIAVFDGKHGDARGANISLDNLRRLREAADQMIAHVEAMVRSYGVETVAEADALLRSQQGTPVDQV